MRKLLVILAAVVGLGLVGAACVPASNPTETNTVVTFINGVRGSLGLAPLAYNPVLQVAATNDAKYFSSRCTLSVTGPGAPIPNLSGLNVSSVSRASGQGTTLAAAIGNMYDGWRSDLNSPTARLYGADVGYGCGKVWVSAYVGG